MNFARLGGLRLACGNCPTMLQKTKNFDWVFSEFYGMFQVNPKVHEIETRAISDIQRAVEESGYSHPEELSNISFLPHQSNIARNRNATTDGNRLGNK